MNLKEYKIQENGNFDEFMKSNSSLSRFSDAFCLVREKFAKSAFDFDGENIIIKGLAIDDTGTYSLTNEKNAVSFNLKENKKALHSFLSIDLYRDYKGDVEEFIKRKLTSCQNEKNSYARFCASNDSEFYDDGRLGRENLNYHLGINEDKPTGCNLSLIEDNIPLVAYSRYNSEIDNYGSNIAFVKIPEDGFVTFFKPHYLADKIEIVEMYHMSEPEAIYACIEHMSRDDFKNFFNDDEQISKLLRRFHIEEELRGGDFSKSKELVETLANNFEEILSNNEIMQEPFYEEPKKQTLIDKLLKRQEEPQLIHISDSINMEKLKEFINEKINEYNNDFEK